LALWGGPREPDCPSPRYLPAAVEFTALHALAHSPRTHLNVRMARSCTHARRCVSFHREPLGHPHETKLKTEKPRRRACAPPPAHRPGTPPTPHTLGAFGGLLEDSALTPCRIVRLRRPVWTTTPPHRQLALALCNRGDQWHCAARSAGDAPGCTGCAASRIPDPERSLGASLPQCAPQGTNARCAGGEQSFSRLAQNGRIFVPCDSSTISVAVVFSTWQLKKELTHVPRRRM
jgi:hypothetical protein